ncbi:uridine kinase [Haliangium sp.]|uniref:amino acid kinase family protein n=1 Tax=Haliangium sp. TaxID=2663208 RepID=UPI003D0D0CDA
MNKLVTGDGRTHIQSSLMRESLQDRRVTRKTDNSSDFHILPDAVLVGIGGQSIFDRGRDALLPLVDEIRALRGQHKMMLGVGGGTRVRHTISVALDLGLPIGGIAQLVGAMEELNAVLLNALLAKDGFIGMPRDHFWELPLYLDVGMVPIVISIPPYHLWEPPPERGNLPAHGSDFGLFQLAEVLAMKQLVFVKDEDGLYTKDPKHDRDATLIPEITLEELLASPPPTTILDRMLFDAWKHARNIERIDIVNGLVPGRLTRALAGDNAGTVITKARPADTPAGAPQGGAA